MTLSRSLIAAAAAALLGLSASASHAAPGDDDDETNPGGHTGQNGLVTWDFHQNKHALWMALSDPLYPNGGAALNAHAQLLLSPIAAGGAETFRYAAKCALSSDTVVEHNGNAFQGTGILTSTVLWPLLGLDVSRTHDLFACMAAHLNPSGTPVGIKLAGQRVNHDPVDEDDPQEDPYTFREALWASSGTSSSTLTIHVWPLEDLKDHCEFTTTTAIYQRVCGTGHPTCNLVVHNDVAADCEESSPGVYTQCNGMNVIQTWLDPIEVPVLHPVCYRRQ